MIKICFNLSFYKFQSLTIELPAVPRVGDQIFFTDFLTAAEEDFILKSNKDVNLDSLIVKHATWLRNKENNDVYVLITLEK